MACGRLFGGRIKQGFVFCLCSDLSRDAVVLCLFITPRRCVGSRAHSGAEVRGGGMAAGGPRGSCSLPFLPLLFAKCQGPGATRRLCRCWGGGSGAGEGQPGTGRGVHLCGRDLSLLLRVPGLFGRGRVRALLVTPPAWPVASSLAGTAARPRRRPQPSLCLLQPSSPRHPTT